jgi:hypothetical protein
LEDNLFHLQFEEEREGKRVLETFAFPVQEI